QYPRSMMDINSVEPKLAVEIVKTILKHINDLPPNLDEKDVEFINIGRQMIDALLTGKGCGGVGCVPHYQIIEELENVYGPTAQGNFLHVHWSMENFVNELSHRRKRLAFLMIPPDASWLLISQYSRQHEYEDVTSLESHRSFFCDYELFIEEGHVSTVTTRFRDMLFQRAPIEEIRVLMKAEKSRHSIGTEPLCKAFFSKVHDIIISVQKQSDFNEIIIGIFYNVNYQISNDEILIPDNLDFWELIIELGDQLYGLVTSENMKYEETLSEFYHMVYPKHGGHFIGRGHTIPKDNTLIWLLLQLFHIEKIEEQVIAEDMKTDESLFSMLIQLYNDSQTRSKDAFYLRDLSLQCAINLQRMNIRDRNSLKQRHPQIVAALHYMTTLHRLQEQSTNYKTKVVDHGLFRDLPIQDMVKVAICSQCLKNLIADILYVYLVPDRRIESGKLGFPETKFLKGGNINYRLLDFINVYNKHRLSQLIYKMMLDGEAFTKSNTDDEQNINCVSPYLLDVVYKIVYSSPWSLELMVKEILEKLKRIDKHTKSFAEGGTPLTETSLRWQHTILQIFSHRFLRLLKYSAKAYELLHHVKYSVSYLDHRQTYHDAETFAIHIMMIQNNSKFIKSLIDPSREKPHWFPESELLARYAIFTLARLIKLRGRDDIHDIESILTSIYPHQLHWSVTTLGFFPEPLGSYLAAQQSGIGAIPSASAGMHVGNLINLFLDQTLPPDDVEVSKEHFSQINNQPIFLCSLWKIGCMRKSINPDIMSIYRKVLLQFPPSRMASYTITLIDFIIEMIVTDPNANPAEVCYQMLDELIWRYQILAFEHVLFALVRGHSETNDTAFGILDYLLFKSEGFSERVSYFISLGFSHRYWIEDDHHDKMMKYLERYPEYFQYEAYAMDGYETVSKPLELPLATHMPIYYTSSIRKSLPILDIVIGRLIEFGEQEMLVKLLDEYCNLYRFHQTPLAFVKDLFCYYYTAPTLRDPAVSTRLIKLIDYDEYDIDSELLQFGYSEDVFEVTYFEKVFHKLAESMSQEKCAPKTDTKLPERHFREIPNPVVLALHIACIEVLATPTSPEDIVKATLDIIIRTNGRKKVSLSPTVIHATGLLYSFLPTEEFVYKMFDEMVMFISTDPHLGEFSQEYNLTLQPQSLSLTFFGFAPYHSTDPLQQWTFSHSTHPFSTMFPYIFNDYSSNLHNFTTNAANSFLTFMHSLLHYSSTGVLQMLFTQLITLQENIRTDIQVLYLCALVGPVMHRLESNSLVLSSYLLHIFQLLNNVTQNMRIEDSGDTTLALEQIYDFLHFIKPMLFNDPLIAASVQQMIRLMKLPIQSRLCGFLIQESTGF
ncbi:10794_t:CDS:10, partial [Acaulospora morrowiae]